MSVPLVNQLRFARSEFRRGLEAVTPEEGLRRFEPMNSVGWMIGHLASQENFYWVRVAQDLKLAPDLHRQVGTGAPASTPAVEEMWSLWHTITQTADRYLETLTTSDLTEHLQWRSRALGESTGTLLQRNIYHYWYHLGEGMAVRQLLGHTDLPEFVGNMTPAAYRPESG